MFNQLNAVVNAYDVGDMIDITQGLVVIYSYSHNIIHGWIYSLTDGGYAVVEDMTLLTTHAFYTGPPNDPHLFRFLFFVFFFYSLKPHSRRQKSCRLECFYARA